MASVINYRILFLVILALTIVAARRRGVTKARPGQAFQMDPDTCWIYPDFDLFLHDNCDQFWECDENNNLVEGWCPPEFPVFDAEHYFCGTEEDATCWYDLDYTDGPDGPETDSECPLNSNEVVLIPGMYCEEYYICLNGVPNLFTCRDGQHWNVEMEYCDDPHSAGCDPDHEHPPTLPDCRSGFTGTLPHPHNCNWFIYCDNGSRSIQQCQHLFHYDIDQNRCLFMNAANCVRDTSPYRRKTKA